MLKIKKFRGVFMRDRLPEYPLKNESAVVNLDREDGSGTHWVAYHKNGKSVCYYDSFGNLKPPDELYRYFGRDTQIYYNYQQHQNYNSVVCGHLCIIFLYNMNIINRKNKNKNLFQKELKHF